MSALPEKNTPQEWEDVVLPLFDQPEAKVPRARSRKEQDDDANKISYRRFKGAPRACADCFDECQAGTRFTFGTAAFIRIEGQAERPLCFEHRALWGEREALAAPRES